MRVVVPALLLSALAACAATREPVMNVTTTELVGTRYVSLPALARDLQLVAVHDRGSFLEMTNPPDAVLLVRESRHAYVNGKTVPLSSPCLLRGEEYVLTTEDAALIERALSESRASRPAPLPPPPQPVVTVSRLPERWRPDAKPRAWTHIVVHHSATPTGSAEAFDRLHRQKDWEGLGYDFVIGNGTGTPVGAVEVGYRWKRQEVGAHAQAHDDESNYWNRRSIGIVLVGDFTKHPPHPRQLDALVELVQALRAEYGIPAANVVPHHHVKPTECPGICFPWDSFLARLGR